MKTTIALIAALLVSCIAQAQYNQRAKDRRSNSQRDQLDTAAERASQGQYANPPVDRRQQSGSYQQQDSTKATPSSPTETFEEKNKPQNPDQYVIDRTTQSDRTDYNLVSTEGMTLMAPADLPASLRKTLKKARYKGWETGQVYRDESTGEFLLMMGKNGNDEQPVNYRFDKDGEVIIEKPGKKNE